MGRAVLLSYPSRPSGVLNKHSIKVPPQAQLSESGRNLHGPGAAFAVSGAGVALSFFILFSFAPLVSPFSWRKRVPFCSFVPTHVEGQEGSERNTAEMALLGCCKSWDEIHTGPVCAVSGLGLFDQGRRMPVPGWNPGLLPHPLFSPYTATEISENHEPSKTPRKSPVGILVSSRH